MATELMRIIDYWIGIPLCILLSVIHRLGSLFAFKRSEKPVTKVLFIKLSEMGGIILSYTLLKRVKGEYPQSDLFFLTFKKNKPIVEILGIITPNNILTIREDSPILFILDTLRAIARMRKEKVDITFDLELFSRFTAILTYVSGAWKRIGFYGYHFEGLYRGNLLTHNIIYNPLIHTGKSLLSLSQGMRLTEKKTPELEKNIADDEIILPKFTPTKESIEQARSRLKVLGVPANARIVFLNPGEGVLPTREWPLENFILVTRRLLDDAQNYVIMIGAGGSSRKTAKLTSVVNNKRCIDLTNKTTLQEALALLAIGDALIANDCGLAHIASLTAIKKFILFGPESPQLYAPLEENTWIFYSQLPCSPCLSALNHRNSSCKDIRCLKAIQPEEVLHVINNEIKETKK